MAIDYQKAWNEHKEAIQYLYDDAGTKENVFGHAYVDGLRAGYLDMLDNMEKIEKTAEYSNIEREVANDIWEIAKKSPEHGNALMDLLGRSTYETISKIKTITDPVVIDITTTYKGKPLKYSENGLAVKLAKGNMEE